ncbi:hypothetical protein Tco_0966904 [Tanacetum coccineum]
MRSGWCLGSQPDHSSQIAQRATGLAGGDAGNGGDGICGKGDDSGVSGDGGGVVKARSGTSRVGWSGVQPPSPHPRSSFPPPKSSSSSSPNTWVISGSLGIPYRPPLLLLRIDSETYPGESAVGEARSSSGCSLRWE